MMIKQTIDECIEEVIIEGHAGFADNGYDIVCAAVSSQVIAFENSLVSLLNIPVESQVNEVEGGYLLLRLPHLLDEAIQHDVQLLSKHFILAMQVTADAYPEFVNVQFQSV